MLVLLHSYCSCVLESLLSSRTSLIVKAEVCPWICVLGACVAFEKAKHLRNSRACNCSLLDEEVLKLQSCLSVYSVFFRLLG